MRRSGLLVMLVFSLLGAVRSSAQDGGEEVKLSLERYERLMQSAGRHVDYSLSWTETILRISLPAADRSEVGVELTSAIAASGAGVVEIPLLPAEVALVAVELDGRPATLARRGGLVYLVLGAEQRTGQLALRYRHAVAGDRQAVMLPLPTLPGARYEISGASENDPLEVWPAQVGGTKLAGTIGATSAVVVRWGADARGYYVRSASYEVTPLPAGDGVDIVLELSLQLHAAAAWIDIAPGREALLEVTDAGQALHTRVAGRQQARVIGAGAHTVRAVMRQAINRGQGHADLQLGMVSASIMRVRVTVPGDRTIIFDPALPSQTELQGEGTERRTTAVIQLPPSDRLGIRWTETPKAPDEDKTRVNCDIIQLIGVDEGVIRSRVVLRYDIIRGAVRELPVQIPDGAVLYKVTGANVEDWPLYAKSNDLPRHARVLLSQEQQGRYELQLELEQRLTAVDAEVAMPLVRPLAMPSLHRQTGVIALFDGDKIGFSVTKPGEGLVRLAEDAIPADIRRQLQAKASHVFRHIGNVPDAFSARVSIVKPREVPLEAQLNSETIQLIAVEEGVIRLRAFLRFEVMRGQVREFAVVIPEGAVLYRVAGEGVVDWPMIARTADAPRHTRVQLDRERTGRYELQLELELRVAPGMTAAMPLPIVKPLPRTGLHRVTGLVALYDGEKIGFVEPQPADGWVRLGDDALPVDIRKAEVAKPVYVFRHIGAPADFAIKVAEVKPREIRFDARINTLYTIKEGQLNARAAALIEVKSGKVDRLVALLPNEAKPLTWTAPSLAKRPEELAGANVPAGMTAYEVRFTKAFEGGIQVAVELEQRLDAQLGQVALPPLSIQGAELEEGAFGVVAEAGIKVAAGEGEGVRQIDIGELPNAIRLQSTRELALGYSYVRAPWKLQVQVERGNLVEVLDAVAEQVWYETTAFADGHLKTVATLRIANERQRTVSFELPKAAQVLKVFLDDAPVKSTRDGDTITIDQLPRASTFLVTVVFESRGEPLEKLGRIEVPALKGSVRMSDLQWQVRVPRKTWVARVDSELERAEPTRFRAPKHGPEVARFATIADRDAFTAYVFTAEQVRGDQAAPRIEVIFGLSWRVIGMAFGVLLLLLALVRFWQLQQGPAAAAAGTGGMSHA